MVYLRKTTKNSFFYLFTYRAILKVNGYPITSMKYLKYVSLSYVREQKYPISPIKTDTGFLKSEIGTEMIRRAKRVHNIKCNDCEETYTSQNKSIYS